MGVNLLHENMVFRNEINIPLLLGDLLIMITELRLSLSASYLCVCVCVCVVFQNFS